MQNQKQTTNRLKQGFSLIEMLVVIAVIGVIASIGLSNVSNVNDSAKTARDQRNAQNIASMFNSAKVAGVAFASATKEEILEELIEGRTSPSNGLDFRFTPLEEDQKTDALDYCEYDSDQEMMKYSSTGGFGATADGGGDPAPDPEPDPAPPVPTEWINFQYLDNGSIAQRISEMESTFPEREWRYLYTGGSSSWIQFRFP